MMTGYGGFGGSWGWHFVPALFFWGLVIIGVVLLIRWLLGARNRVATPDDPALRILRERYAKGEIDLQQFERMQAELKNS